MANGLNPKDLKMVTASLGLQKGVQTTFQVPGEFSARESASRAKHSPQVFPGGPRQDGPHLTVTASPSHADTQWTRVGRYLSFPMTKGLICKHPDAHAQGTALARRLPRSAAAPASGRPNPLPGPRSPVPGRLCTRLLSDRPLPGPRDSAPGSPPRGRLC